MVDKDPILSFLYNTKEEALKTANKLGCGGYRTYIIDGVKKYVPCSSVEEFEKVFRIQISQGKIVGNGNETNSDKLVGLQLADTSEQTDALFTLGNFNITTFTPEKINKAFKLPDATKLLSAEQLAQARRRELQERLGDGRVKLNLDYTDFESYVSYGSLIEKIRVTLQYIIEQFPSGITVRGGTRLKPLINDYSYNTFENTSTFSINSSYMLNPFNIIYASSGATTDLSDNISEYRNFTKTFTDYVLVVDGINYPVIDYVAPESDVRNGLITVEGDPFNTTLLNSQYYNKSYQLIPKNSIVNNFFSNLDDFGRFLLNKNTKPKYVIEFNVPFENDNGELVFKTKTLNFPMIDTHNIDIVSDNYQNFIDELNEISNEFDTYKTNLVARFFTTDAFKEYDTEDKKIEKVLHLYGKEFDEIKKYIDGIANMTKVSYDKINNIPDLLIKNFATTLGWKTFNIENEDSIIQNLFKFDVEEPSDDDITVAELDIELWRRLVINSAHLFKSKGTRKSIEFILKMVGVPESIIEINEYIHLADRKLDYQDVSNNVINPSQYPIDDNGYPTVPKDTYFQSNGGNIIENSENIGKYDNGQNYINKYLKFGDYYAFDVYKTVDNKKSWVYTENEINRLETKLNRDVDYTLKHSDLVINSKETDVFISLDRVFDTAMYRYYNRNNISIDAVNNGSITKSGELTFNKFLRDTLKNYINVVNRKTTITYPRLSKIYYDYQQLVDGESKTYIEYSNALKFLNNFDTYWTKLVMEFTPSTTILTAGKKIQNSQFLDSKHQHKRGTNKSLGWLGTDGSEFQDKALSEVNKGESALYNTFGSNNSGNLFSGKPFSILGSLKNNYSGYLERAAKYSTHYYGFYDFCQNNNNILGVDVMNNGSFTGLFPNIYEIDVDVVNSVSLGSNTSGVTFYTRPVSFPSVYNSNIEVGSQDNTGTYDLEYYSVVQKTEVDNVDSISGESVKITTNDLTSIGALTKAVYFKLSNLTLTVGVEYKLTYHYKSNFTTHSGTPNFTHSIGNSSGVTSDITYLNNSWKKVEVSFTPTNSNVAINFLSTTGVPDENSTINIDSFSVEQKASDSFQSAFDEIDVSFMCPTPLPHACYSPVVTQATGNEVPIDLIKEYSLSLNYDTEWTKIDIDASNGFTFSQQPLTVNGPNGLKILTSSDIKAGKQALIYINDVDLTQGNNYYFEFELFSDDTTVTQHSFTPVLVYYSSEDRTLDITYPKTFIGENKLFGEFKNSDIIQNVNYAFGLLITAGEAHAEYLTDVKIYEKPIYQSNGETYVLNQPFNYGFSKSEETTKPNNSVAGESGDWLVPYIKFGGDKVNNNDVLGPYEEIDSRAITDPLMHVKTSLVNKVVPNALNDYFEINLTDKALLKYVFFDKDTPLSSIEPEDGEINGQIYQSDSVSIEFDGFYPLKTILDNGGPGPNYDVKTNEYTDDSGLVDEYDVRTLYFQLNGTYNCPQNQITKLMLVNNFANITGSTFPNSDNNVSMITSSEGGYIVSNNYTKVRVEVDLIFDSDFSFNQEILVRLVDRNNNIYAEDTFNMSGPSNTSFEGVDSRIIKFSDDIFIRENDEIYIAVVPVDADCRILVSEEETITDYEFKLMNPSTTPVTSGQLSNFSYISGNTLDDSKFENGFMTLDEYTEVTLTISERPSSNFPENLKTFSGYLVGYGYNYLGFPFDLWNQDTNELLISTNPVNRIDFYPYVPNGTFNPLDNDFIPGQSMFNFINDKQTPIFNGYSYTYSTNSNETQTVTGNSLSGNTITLKKFSGIKIYPSTVSSLSTNVKNNLIAFNSLQNMKATFAGFDNGIGIEYAQELFYDATDNNNLEVNRYGTTDFIRKNNGLYLRHYYARDLAGYQRTGEFIGKLTIKDVCGNRASIYLLTLISLDPSITPSKPNQKPVITGGSSDTDTDLGFTDLTGGDTSNNTGGGSTSTDTGSGTSSGTSNSPSTVSVSIDFEGLENSTGELYISGSVSKLYLVNGDRKLDTFSLNAGDSITLVVRFDVFNGTFVDQFTVNGVGSNTTPTPIFPNSSTYEVTRTINNVNTNQNVIIKLSK